MKRNIQISKVPFGGIVSAFGDQFVVLDHIYVGVFCIRKDILKTAPFDTSGRANLREASVINTLNDYRVSLRERGAADDDILTTWTDLKGTVGSNDYGCFEAKVSLLTLEQYGTYREIIPVLDETWWLSTPFLSWCSPFTSNTDLVWRVYSNGDFSNGGARDSDGVRPVLTFSPMLSVLWDDETNAEKNDPKFAAFNDYCQYLAEWAESHRNANAPEFDSPRPFAEWYEREWSPFVE